MNETERKIVDCGTYFADPSYKEITEGKIRTTGT